ncbi:MAG: sulfatase-like hydrolase/transferase, partial [Tannerellaceae bacterium]
TIYENSMRIPLLIRYPQKVKARMETTMMSLMDLYPTMLTLVGLNNRIGKQVQAIDYSPLIISGEGSYPKSQPYFKYVYLDSLGGTRGIRTERYSYCIDFEQGKSINVLLFDREKDPFQINNIAETADQALIAELNKQLYEWLVKANDPLSNHFCIEPPITQQ